MAAQGGVFKVKIDPDVVPDDWKLPPGTIPTESYRVDSNKAKSPPASKQGGNGGNPKKSPIYSISG